MNQTRTETDESTKTNGGSVENGNGKPRRLFTVLGPLLDKQTARVRALFGEDGGQQGKFHRRLLELMEKMTNETDEVLDAADEGATAFEERISKEWSTEKEVLQKRYADAIENVHSEIGSVNGLVTNANTAASHAQKEAGNARQAAENAKTELEKGISECKSAATNAAGQKIDELTRDLETTEVTPTDRQTNEYKKRKFESFPELMKYVLQKLEVAAGLGTTVKKLTDAVFGNGKQGEDGENGLQAQVKKLQEKIEELEGTLETLDNENGDLFNGLDAANAEIAKLGQIVGALLANAPKELQQAAQALMAQPTETAQEEVKNEGDA